ncbi:MAG: putative 3-oxoacyl-[acyl-carrier-protein] reductase [Symbiobacteriaceae bacterium]|nr:putative 3-oxoacyl-[acyl-carrier-protein] reductase [Symbiobacteriaceae bacterium]
MELTGKVALITGGAGGLGRAFARTLVEAGADICLFDVDQSALDEATAALAQTHKHRRCVGLTADVRSPAAVQQAVTEAVTALGSIDILINNAGGSLHTPKALLEITEADWDLVLDVNLKGTFNCCQAVIPLMRDRGGGRIINLSSIGGRTASIVTGVPYAAAKAGIIGLTRRLAKEAGPWGINVNAIAPGTVLSGERMVRLWQELSPAEQQQTLETIPLGRLSTPEEQAEVVRFLAGPGAVYITGAVIDTNGGRFMG